MNNVKFSQTELLELWSKFGEVKINACDEIEEDFLHFNIGTDRLEIWSWFDEHLENGLAVKDLMHQVVSSTQFNEITSTLVAEENRSGFTPKYFKQYFMEGEQLVFRTMTHYSKDYSGGFWEFKELSNGSFYMMPPEQQYTVTNANNYAEETLSADAAGIFVTAMVLNSFMFISTVPENTLEHFVKMFRGLMDYVNQHEECGKLKSLLD